MILSLFNQQVYRRLQGLYLHHWYWRYTDNHFSRKLQNVKTLWRYALWRYVQLYNKYCTILHEGARNSDKAHIAGLGYPLMFLMQQLATASNLRIDYIQNTRDRQQ